MLDGSTLIARPVDAVNKTTIKLITDLHKISYSYLRKSMCDVSISAINYKFSAMQNV